MDKDRRKFKRFDAYMSVQVKATDGDVKQSVNLSKDLSREGIKFNSNKKYEKGAVLDFEITIPDDPRPVFTTGKVMWSIKAAGDDQGYEQGVRFTKIDPIDKFRVLDFAYNHWLETKVNDYSDPEKITELE